MRSAKWFVWPCLTVLGFIVIDFSAARAADSPETLAKRKLQRKADQYRASEKSRNELSRNWVLSRAIDESIGLESFNFDTPIIRENSPPRSGFASSGATPPAPSPGLDIGLTSYDYQAYSSQAYQVARTPTGQDIHFCWMFSQSLPSGIESFNRFVHYASIDKAILIEPWRPYNGVAVTGADNRAGYCNIDVTSTNQAQVGLHMRATGLDDPYTPWHVRFPFPPSATADLIALGGYDNSCPEVLWPRLTADRSGAVIHEIAHSYVNDCLDDKLWYWRFDPGSELWTGPALIDNTEEISYVLAVDANSDKVAVAVHVTEGGMSNVAFIETASDGANWINGTEIPPVRTTITNYTDPNGPQAWVHLTTTYDNSSALHVMWDEQENSASEHIAIKHWNSSRNTIRTAALGYWDRPVSTGVFNLNLAKMTMGIGDGSTLCQGGAQSNNNYVYVVYTQFGGDTPLELSDYSSEYSYEDRIGGYMNGELYLAVSNSGGNTWSLPVNLTNTKTPGCNPGPANMTGLPANPDSVCRSEHWATIGRVVRDIDIFFISDLDAGGIPQGEGSWQLNPVHYLRLPGGTTNAQHVCPVIAPVFWSTLSSDPDCEYNATRVGSTTATLTIFNLGSATLNQGAGGGLVVTDFPGLPTLSVPGTGPYSIIAGSPDVVKTVTMTSNNAAEGLYVGQIDITHNDASKPSPRTNPIDFFVYDQFFCPQSAPRTVTGATGPNGPGSLQLAVSNDGRFGSQSPEGGLWRHSDSSSSIFDASLLVAHGPQGPDTTVFLRFYDRATNGQAGFRAQSDLIVDISSYGTGSGCAHATAKMSTRDSVVGVSVDWVFPQDPTLDEFVLARYKFYRHNPDVPVTNLVVGMLVDAEVLPSSRLGTIQAGATNRPGSDGTRNLVWAGGVDTSGHNPVGQNTATRFRAGVIFPDGYEGIVVGNSVADLQPGGGPSDGFLYNALTTSAGIDLYSISDTDLYVLAALDRGQSIAVGETLSYTVIFLSDTVSEASLKATADQALAVAATLCVPCSCPCKHDPQCDGVLSDVLDVVVAVDVAFRGLPAFLDPACPNERTDVDADGVTSITDVVKVINVAFRGQTGAANYVDPCL